VSDRTEGVVTSAGFLLADYLWRSSTTGVALVDRRGCVLRANEALERLASGRPLVGRMFTDVVAAGQLDAASRLLNEAAPEWSALRLGLDPDARGVPHDYLVSAVVCDEGVLVVAERSIGDVDAVNAELVALNEELVQVQRALRRRSGELADQNERLLELDRLKDEFVSLISHEFRTPLTSMHGYLDLLREDDDSFTAKQKEFLQVLDRNTQRLLRLVNDLLFVAQLDAGQLQLAAEAVEPAALARECVEAIRPLAAAKAIEVGFAAEQVPRVVADRGRIVQLLDNLLTNAVKFTPSGGRVHVGVSLAADRVVVQVADTGIGIPDSERDQVFERFFRTERASRRAIPGSGLGLVVVKSIVEAHGGTIAVAGSGDSGTTFRVELPVAGVPAHDQPAGGR